MPTATLSIVVFAAALSCGDRKPSWTSMVGRSEPLDSTKPAPRCPPGTASDDKRTQEVLLQLGSQNEGRRLLVALGRTPRVCYGDAHEGSLQTDGALVLQRDRPPAANAARLGHLLHHLVRGLPLDETTVRASTLTCSELVRNAGLAEHTAYQLESELRRGFGLPPLPFEDLREQYRQRCQALRDEPARRSTM
jgi:hypothetical protein